MKNDNFYPIKQTRSSKLYKATSTDILISPEVIKIRRQKLAGQPRRKRHVNYAKKILNDPFVFNV